MRSERFSLPGLEIPAVLYGEPADRVWLYIHGKLGCKEEAEPFAELACARGAQVLAMDLPRHGARQNSAQDFVPWDAVPEVAALLAYARERWERVSLRAVSLGAWFSLLACGDGGLDRALLVSPVLDMAALIETMMGWAGVTAAQLEAVGEIPTDFGETLSWRYLQYAWAHPVTQWEVPTAILYGGRDHLTSQETVTVFSRRFGCRLTVLEEGEHWLHTPEELAALRRWEVKALS